MKWIAGSTVLCFVMGACALFLSRSEWRCLLNLSVFDHNINCTGHVAMMTDEGTVSNGVWSQKYILGLTPPECLCCPITGTNYVLTFRVGQHPYCPVHGRLIEKYDVRPHQPNAYFRWQRTRDAAAAACGLVGIAGVLVMAVGFVVRKTRRRQARCAVANDPPEPAPNQTADVDRDRR